MSIHSYVIVYKSETHKETGNQDKILQFIEKKNKMSLTMSPGQIP